MCHVRTLSFILALASPAMALAQGSIHGRVTDATTGTPLSAAQISVVGTRLGGLTDESGSYTITGVPSGPHSVLVRRIGYGPTTRQIDVGASATATLDVALSPASTSLERVVVTGTATPTQVRALGTSVASVGPAEIAQSRAQSVDQALQGKVAGAQITQNSGAPGGGGISVRLRGTSSLISGSEPLYIVDGVIIDNSSDQLVDLGARSNVQNRLADIAPEDIERVEIIRGAAAAALYGSRANNGVVQIFTKHGRAGSNRTSFQTRVGTEQLAKKLAFNMSPVDASGKPVQRYDYQNDIFRTGNNSETYLSFDGGNQATQYYVGGSYTNENGIIQASSSMRRSGRVNLTQQVSPKLQLNVGGNYVSTHNEFEPNGEQTTGVITALLFTPTNFSFFPVNGVYPAAPTGSSFANPLQVIAQWRAPQDVHRFIGNATANWNPFQALTTRYTLGYDGYNMEADQYISPNSLGGTQANGQSSAAIRESRIVNQDGVATLTTHPTDRIELGTSVGFNVTQQVINTTTALATSLLPTGELVSEGSVTSGGQTRYDLRTLGFYGQQTAAFADRLYLTAALRRDASSTFGVNQRWQDYPKFSASYVVSDEPAFKRSIFAKPFSSLRLRAAVGYAGNQPSIANAYSQYDNYVRAISGTRIGAVNSTILGNPNLRPERQRETEFGADMGFLKERVTLEATAYDKRVTDALLLRPLATSTGYSSQFDNIGDISNKGVELMLHTVNFDRPAFNWQSTVTYSRNKNRVDRLVVAPFTAGYANRVQQGLPIGVFYAEIPLKNAAGKDSIDASGLIVRDPKRTMAVVGDPNPRWLGSFLNEFTIARNFRVRGLLDGSFGNDVLNFTRRTMDTFGTSAATARELLPAGDPNKLPTGYLRSQRFYYGKYVEDGTYVKLREVSVTYDLPSAFAQSLHAGSAALTLSGRNLHTWTKYTGYDPEMNLFGQLTVERGNDFGTYPIPRTYSIGLNATF
jgi:TonB-linked SusC/RagA family outer membrane protein